MLSRNIGIVSILLIAAAAMASDVSILPLRGPMGTAKISPGNGSSTAYLMDFPGQSSICFQSASTTVVFISSSSTIGANGWGLYNKGENLCLDLTRGTTVYFYGSGAGGDVRAVMAR